MNAIRGCMCAVLLIAGFAAPAAADDWSSWYALSDGYKNRIDVRYQRSSIKAADGHCDIQYQFRNRYSERASFAFKVITDGGRISAEGRQELGKGESSWAAANVHSTKEIWVQVEGLHAAGSHVKLPAAD